MADARPARRASVKDVAAAAGVSLGTVSNVLNHPEKVSPATLERTLAVIDELRFVRNDAARQLRAGTSRAIAMIALDVGNPFFIDVARGVEKVLAQHRRPLVLANSAQDVARERDYLDLCEELRVSGILITPTGRVLPRLRQLHEAGVRTVLVDCKTGATEFSSVTADDRLGARLAIEHLLSIGRRHIAFIGGPIGLTQVKARWTAAQAAVQPHRTASIRFIDPTRMDAEAGRIATEHLITGRQRLDAIFASNDLLALGALQALTTAGLSVPDDIALIGYDDIDFAASAAVPLTSVRQPREDMGARATQILLEHIADPTAPVRHDMLRPELIIRRSTSG